MRKSKAVERCETLICKFVEDNYGVVRVSETALRKLIKEEIGADPRTVKNWIENLEDFGFIKRNGVKMWQLGLDKVSELAVGGERQKRLV